MEQLLQQIEALHLRMPEMLLLPKPERIELMNRFYDLAEELEESVYGPIGEFVA